MSYSNLAIDIAGMLSPTASKARTSATQSFMGMLDLQNGKSFKDVLAQNKADILGSNPVKSVSDLFSNQMAANEEILAEFEKSSINGMSGEDLLAAFSEYTSSLDEKTKELGIDLDAEENALNMYAMNFLYPYGVDNGANISEQELRFNASEIDTLIGQMKKAGFNDSAVFQAMQDAAQNVNGVSDEELQAIVANAIFGAEQALTLKEQEELLSLSQKLVSSKDVAEEVASQLITANPAKALDSLANAIERNGEIMISQDEMQALMSTLQMSDEQKAQVMSFFAGAENVVVDKEAFNMLFAGARQKLAENQENFAKFAQSYAEEISSIESLARERTQAATSAQNAETKQAEISRKLLEHDLITNVVDGLREKTLSSDSVGENTLRDISGLDDVVSAELRNGNGVSTEAALAELSIKNSINETSIKDTLAKFGPQNMADSLKSAMELSGRGDNSSNSSDKQASKENNMAFASFLGNVQADRAGNLSQTNSSEMAKSVFSQLENSILSATKKNVTTLEVKLNPVELGALNIVLTMKNGELSALIQPEKLETMNMINKQIDALKAELENQGVKLDKIEVELKSTDDDSSSMYADSNTDSNFGQESSSQNGYEQLEGQLNDLDRLRLLGRDILAGTVDFENVSPEDLELAQNLLDNAEVEEELRVFDTYSSVNLMA